MRWLRGVGLALVVMGLAGFLTVADDLRHKGELLGVSVVAAGGLVLVALSVWRRRSSDGPTGSVARREGEDLGSG